MSHVFVGGQSSGVSTQTSLYSLFSDDFGGSAIDTSKWDVIDGGLRVGTILGKYTSTVNIGTGTTGILDSVSSSSLAVAMGTTSGAERWYLSKDMFNGKEDIFVVLSKSQANVNNSIRIGLIEVDVNGMPKLNPNLAGEGTNWGGAEFGASATTTAYHAEAIGDSSGSIASGVLGVATAWTTPQEALIEIDSRDITVSTMAVDALTAKAVGASRVSTQCPNDKKKYKLLMRFVNTGVPTATTVTISRVLVVDNFEQRVQISTGEGDTIASKAVPVSITGASAATTSIGGVTLVTSASLGAATTHKLISAATTNATSVKVTAGNVSGGAITNTTAGVKYFKFYNKASAPTVGSDTPTFTIALPAGGCVALGDFVGFAGYRMSTGIAYAITGLAADADTTAVAAGDVVVNLLYT